MHRLQFRYRLFDHVGRALVKQRVLARTLFVPQVSFDGYLEFVTNLWRLVYRPGQSCTAMGPAVEDDRNPLSSSERCRGAGRLEPFFLLDLSPLVLIERPEGREAEPTAQVATGSRLRAVLTDDTFAQRDARSSAGY
jgi:hypothetical protein